MRFACRILSQHRSTQRKIAKTPDDETALTADIVALAVAMAIAGSQRCCGDAGWVVNFNRRTLSISSSQAEIFQKTGLCRRFKQNSIDCRQSSFPRTGLMTRWRLPVVSVTAAKEAR